MSDEFLREVKEDLEKEKALLFLKKYGISLAIGAAVILGGVTYYGWHKDKNEKLYQAQADAFWEKSQNIIEDPKKSPDFSGINDVYKSLLTHIRVGQFTQEDDSDVAGKIIADHVQNNVFDNTQQKDYVANSLLHLHAIAEMSEKETFDTIEDAVKNYARISGSFKALAYEILIAKAFQTQKYDKATYYLELLSKNGYDAGQGTPYKYLPFRAFKKNITNIIIF